MLIASDIETGPLPDRDLLRLYVPPVMPGQFDPATVDIGRAVKQETIDKKIAEAKVEHEAILADWDGYCEQHQAGYLATTKEKAALDPLTGQVLAIGYLIENYEPLVLASGDEDETLESWWEICDEFMEQTIVFHNGFGFDLPFLVRRSWLLDVTVPDWVLSFRGSRVYFNQDSFADTMTTWTMGEYGKFIKLNALAKIFGFGGKLEGCTGADFSRMWHGTPEERALAIRYLEQDVRITMQIAQAMGLG